MAIEIISAEDVLAASGANKAKSYPAKARDGHRLLPFAEVANTPKFTFDANAKIFTVGSCFARNVERSLIRSGYQITSSAEDFHNPFPNRQPFHRFNKYTVPAIQNEIAWALGEAEMDMDKLLVEVTRGQYCDLQTGTESLRAPYDEMVKFRTTFNAKFKPIADADVVMFTLGLAECWYDNVAGVYLNHFPGVKTIKTNPDRFHLHVLDYDEIYKGLVDTYDMIARHNPDFKMLVTVSPVPLDRTFRADDVLVANTYSKAVQRAAVEAFVANYPADYFPSYETVTLTDSKYAWSDLDFRHVRGEMVDRLMGNVLAQYTQISAHQSAQKTRGYVTAYLQAGDLPKADAALQEHVDAFDLSLGLMYPAADIAFRKGDADTAADILRKLIASIDRDIDTANAALDDRAALVRTQAGTMLEQCQRYADQPDKGATVDMEQIRARSAIDAQLKSDPANTELQWLRAYFDRTSAAPAVTAEQQENVNFLQEVSAVSRFRVASRAGDLDKAEEIALKAAKELGYSELVQWELGIMYRYNDRAAEAFEVFEKIARFGGPKSVAAVRNALRLAPKLGKEEQIADLADLVAEQIQT